MTTNGRLPAGLRPASVPPGLRERALARAAADARAETTREPLADRLWTNVWLKLGWAVAVSSLLALNLMMGSGRGQPSTTSPRSASGPDLEELGIAVLSRPATKPRLTERYRLDDLEGILATSENHDSPTTGGGPT
jgi:hypothetical protein